MIALELLALVAAYLTVGFGVTCVFAWLDDDETWRRGWIAASVLFWPVPLVLLTAVAVIELVRWLGPDRKVVAYIADAPFRVVNRLAAVRPPFDTKSEVEQVKVESKPKRQPNGSDYHGNPCVVYRVTNSAEADAIAVNLHHVAWQGSHDCWCGMRHSYAKAYPIAVSSPHTIYKAYDPASKTLLQAKGYHWASDPQSWCWCGKEHRYRDALPWGSHVTTR